MIIRIISLLVFLAVGGIRSFGQITITPASNSSILVNGHHPGLTVTAPAEGATATVTMNTISFSAAVDSFALGATTSGDWPCESSSRGEGFVIADGGLRWKGGGQAIYVIIDNGAGRLVMNTSTAAPIPVANTAGPHTLRACLIRSWDESVKDVDNVSPLRETDLYTVRTFYIDTNTGTHAIDTTKPLLMPIAPLDTVSFVYHPDSVLLDFNLMFAGLEDGYRVAVTFYDSTQSVLKRDTLVTWGPHCIGGLEEAPEGRLRKYFVRMRLIDENGDPVTNGPGNFNERLWAFWVRKS